MTDLSSIPREDLKDIREMIDDIRAALATSEFCPEEAVAAFDRYISVIPELEDGEDE